MCKYFSQAYLSHNYLIINTLQNLLFCVLKAQVLQGKSGCFASQKSRFRNAKTKLPLFNGIIFTKAKRKLRRYTLYIIQGHGIAAKSGKIGRKTILRRGWKERSTQVKGRNTTRGKLGNLFKTMICKVELSKGSFFLCFPCNFNN